MKIGLIIAFETSVLTLATFPTSKWYVSLSGVSNAAFGDLIEILMCWSLNTAETGTGETGFKLRLLSRSALAAGETGLLYANLCG